MPDLHLPPAQLAVATRTRGSTTRRGYLAEAAAAILDIAFGEIGLHRVSAELDPRNERSAALCRRLGMREEARFVEDTWFKGAWGDSAIYAILDRAWAARPAVG